MLTGVLNVHPGSPSVRCHSDSQCLRCKPHLTIRPAVSICCHPKTTRHVKRPHAFVAVLLPFRPEPSVQRRVGGGLVVLVSDAAEQRGIPRAVGMFVCVAASDSEDIGVIGVDDRAPGRRDRAVVGAVRRRE